MKKARLTQSVTNLLKLALHFKLQRRLVLIKSYSNYWLNKRSLESVKLRINKNNLIWSLVFLTHNTQRVKLHERRYLMSSEMKRLLSKQKSWLQKWTLLTILITWYCPNSKKESAQILQLWTDSIYWKRLARF